MPTFPNASPHQVDSSQPERAPQPPPCDEHAAEHLQGANPEAVSEADPAIDARLREKMLHAMRRLEQAPESRTTHGEARYALPWYLLIGPPQSGKTALLQGAARHFAPFARPTASRGGVTRDCDWWLFKSLIVVDTTGDVAVPPDMARDDTLWAQLLRLLRQHREAQPINGLIVTAAADALLTKAEDELQFDAAELRKRLDEAMRALGIVFPVYLVVTRCDLLEGFTAFFACVPEPIVKQVFGYVYDASAHTTDSSRLATSFEPLVTRLEHLRLAIFNGQDLPPDHVRQNIFLFPEALRALQQPLEVFMETLFSENPFQHTPLCRGLFFTSALQQGVPVSPWRRQVPFAGPAQTLTPGQVPYFVHDLFAEIVPRDRVLITPLSQSRQGSATSRPSKEQV